MRRLIDDIILFLADNGFECSVQMRDGSDVISVRMPDGKRSKIILPLEIKATTAEEAGIAAEETERRIRFITITEGRPLVVTEDRWNSQKESMQARLLAHLEIFSQSYARNCEVRRIEKTEAQDFLNRYHSYGHAACKYCYGLFLKRHTGHIAEEITAATGSCSCDDCGKLIAVAAFSNARKWKKDGREIRSYEWTRYASLPQMRVSGGMGKLLKAFIKEVSPDDIMSYADLEWSEGEVYKTLGFTKEHIGKEPVCFTVDPVTWERKAIGKYGLMDENQQMTEGKLFFRNSGSHKYRLKLTEYR